MAGNRYEEGRDWTLSNREPADHGAAGHREQPSFGPADDPAFHEQSYHGQPVSDQRTDAPQTYGTPDFGGFGSDYIGPGQHSGRGPKGYTRSDGRIAEDASERLSADPWLDASNIEVSIEDAEITLSGTVSARDDKHRAEQLLDNVPGLRHVQNNLRVQ